MSSQPESVLVNAVIRYLWHNGCYVWRNNTGAYKPEGRDRYVRYGTKGSSDVLGIAPDGTFVAVECKTETGQVSADQEEFLSRVRTRGGIALIVRPSDYSDLIDAALAAGKEPA